jgi:hypothetical protein
MELNPTDAYIKASCAAAFTLAGEPERSLCLLDEAETLDPFLPVYCVEERGVALYALGRLDVSSIEAARNSALGRKPSATSLDPRRVIEPSSTRRTGHSSDVLETVEIRSALQCRSVFSEPSAMSGFALTTPSPCAHDDFWRPRFVRPMMRCLCAGAS